jgi:hypothetical protein
MPCAAFGVVQEMTIFISTFLFFFFYVFWQHYFFSLVGFIIICLIDDNKGKVAY